jgi:hypothetical protein
MRPYPLISAMILLWGIHSTTSAQISVDTARATPSSDSAAAARKKASSTGLEVKPVKIDFHLSKGESAYQPIYITNNFNRSVQFKARFSDWMRDSLGGHVYLEPGTIPRSCAQWMSFNKDMVEIEPGKTKEILVRMKIPDSVSVTDEMKWCLVFLESVVENKAYKPSDSSRTYVNTIFRVGIHILQTPPQLESQKDMQMLSFSSVEGKENLYRILCYNSGKTELDCKSYIELSSLASGEKTTLEPIRFTVFPEQRRYTEFALPATIAKGKYAALAVVDAGEDDIPLQASEAVIEVK